MPYRSRPINWNLLTGPVSRGLDYRNQASLNFSRTLMGVGQDIGQGFIRRRTMAESKRRYDLEYGLQQERMDMARQRFQMDAAEQARRDEERRVNNDMLKGIFLGTADQANQEIAATGQLSPATGEQLKKSVTAIGGPDAATVSLLQREAECPGGT